MNRMIKGLACGVIGLGGVASSGCASGEKQDYATQAYNSVADPCWPDRYAAQARELQVAQFEPQVMNGHVLDQTIWNMHFNAGSDVINAAGMDKLDQLARRRPQPDTVLYLQTTRDIAYDPDKPSDYVTKRGDLDAKRIAAIQKYLGSTLSGRQSAFTVEIHDPSYPGIEGAAPRLIIPSPRQRATGAGPAGSVGAVVPGSATSAPPPGMAPSAGPTGTPSPGM